MPCAPSITLALKDKRKVYKAKIKRIVTGSFKRKRYKKSL
jgi:hypothetical protein